MTSPAHLAPGQVLRIESSVFSRAGLLGNPSDAFGGAAVAVLAANYGAGVVLEASAAEAESLTLVPDPEADSNSFSSLRALEKRVSDHGFYGGLRLMSAACVAFERRMQARKRELGESKGGGGVEGEAEGRGGGGGGDLKGEGAETSRPPCLSVSLSYWSSIPRQSGMSGSSAIILAALDALARLQAWREGTAPAVPSPGAGSGERTLTVPPEDGERVLPRLARPAIALGAEEALGIAAGWMDRVIQSFGGSVLLDLQRDGQPPIEEGEEVGSPQVASPSLLVRRVAASHLPPLYLLRVPSLPPKKDSGSVHADVRRRWKAGETEVAAAMRRLAEIAREGAEVLEAASGKVQGGEGRREEDEGIAGSDAKDEQGAAVGGASSRASPEDARPGSLPAPSVAARLARLVDENYGIRLALYGPRRLGPVNLRLRALAESVGASATLAGSGGTLIAVCPEGEEQEQRLVDACRRDGASAERLRIAPELVDVPPKGIEIAT